MPGSASSTVFKLEEPTLSFDLVSEVDNQSIASTTPAASVDSRPRKIPKHETTNESCVNCPDQRANKNVRCWVHKRAYECMSRISH